MYLLILVCLFGDSNTLNVKEILKKYFIEQKIYPNHQDERYVDYYSDLSWYVSDCTVFFVDIVVRYKWFF